MDTEIEDTHELALDALMRTIDQYGGVWSNDADELRGLLSPLVVAIGDLASDYAGTWDRAEQVLREAAGRR